MANTILEASMDGITPLPPGHVAAIKTYLERDAALGALPAAPRSFELIRLRGADAARYRALFEALGLRWLWWSRLQLTSNALTAILDSPQVEAYAVAENGKDIGLLEWDFSQIKAPELAFLGLIDEATGRGLGRSLMAATIERLSRAPATKIRVNTCTFDSPAALQFYRRCGFKVVLQAVEIVPDPRLTGVLPREAAPHVPIVGA